TILAATVAACAAGPAAAGTDSGDAGVTRRSRSLHEAMGFRERSTMIPPNSAQGRPNRVPHARRLLASAARLSRNRGWGRKMSHAEAQRRRENAKATKSIAIARFYCEQGTATQSTAATRRGVCPANSETRRKNALLGFGGIRTHFWPVSR